MITLDKVIPTPCLSTFESRRDNMKIRLQMVKGESTLLRVVEASIIDVPDWGIGLPKWVYKRWRTRMEQEFIKSGRSMHSERSLLWDGVWVCVKACPAIQRLNEDPAILETRLRIRKITRNVYVPTTEGLARAKATTKSAPLSIDDMDWHGIIATGLDQHSVLPGSLFAIKHNQTVVFRVVDWASTFENEDMLKDEQKGDARAQDGIELMPLPALIVEASKVKVEILAPDFTDCDSGGTAYFDKEFGGYSQQLVELAGLLEASLHHSVLHDKLKIAAPRAILLSGPIGVGKSHIIQHVVDEVVKVSSFKLDILELVIEYQNAAKVQEEIDSDYVCSLRKSIHRARCSAPAVVIIENLELICEGNNNLSIDASLISKRIAAEIELQLPSSCGSIRYDREDIIRTYLKRLKLERDSSLKLAANSSVLESYVSKLVQITPGFVGRDLEEVIRQALLSASERDMTSRGYLPSVSHGPDTIDALTHRLSTLAVDDSTPTLKLSWRNDFIPALRIVKPSQAGESGFITQKPDIGWDEVGGRLQRLALLPFRSPETFTRLGVKPPAGILLYGPSGCGKTLMIRALASNSPMNFISVSGSQIFSKYFGESEATLRRVFDTARRLSPCILFFDDIDTLGTRREWEEDGTSGVNERVLSTLLNEMDGVGDRKGVVVVAATNLPEMLDDALLRPGRLDQHIYVPMPSLDDRISILKGLVDPSPVFHKQDGLPDEEMEKNEHEFLMGSGTGGPWDPVRAAKLTEGFTGADLATLVREAGFLAIRERGEGWVSRIVTPGVQAEGNGASFKGGLDNREIHSKRVRGIAWRHVQLALRGAMMGSLEECFAGSPKRGRKGQEVEIIEGYDDDDYDEYEEDDEWEDIPEKDENDTDKSTPSLEPKGLAQKDDGVDEEKFSRSVQLMMTMAGGVRYPSKWWRPGRVMAEDLARFEKFQRGRDGI
ncbi:hypothetical protein HDU76_008436 [Blyttiomyces sp. JEL0837]|nr:hypothetical protein HDU76_008436 [Blyttiomyces sp. JEL0837]